MRHFSVVCMMTCSHAPRVACEVLCSARRQLLVFPMSGSLPKHRKLLIMSSRNFSRTRPTACKLSIALAALLGTLATAAHAQNAPQNAQAFAPNTILIAAEQTLQQVDAKQSNTLYQQTPAFVKDKVQRNAFTKGISQERDKLGTVTGRQWVGINRVILAPEQNQPPVSCANVQFVALRQNALVGSEQVSLCFDQQQWRATGYVAAIPQAQPQAAPANSR